LPCRTRQIAVAEKHPCTAVILKDDRRPQRIRATVSGATALVR